MKKSEFYINRLEQQIDEINQEILIEIGKKIKYIGTLSPIEVMKVINMLKFGTPYEEIRKKLQRLTHKSYAEIDAMFENIAKENQYFAKPFYKYRNIPYVPLGENIELKNYVQTLADVAKRNYAKMLNSRMLGYGIIDDTGKYKLLGIKDTINYAIDKAVASITQGKDTFQQEMYKTIKQLGGSGLRVISDATYIDKDGNVNNYTKRLDSTVRTYMLDTARDFQNNMQLKFGEEFGADGVEITVHENPAPDHAPLQGRQFSIEEFTEIQAGKYGRAIGQYNCYHGILMVVLGVNKPQYSEKELQKILEDNEKGFVYNGKHYTKYEGTQMQRRLETEIRKQKDIQILAKESGNMELVAESQSRITKLNSRYKDLCNQSGLLPQKDRMRVSGYRRIKVSDIKEKYIEGNKTLEILNKTSEKWWNNLTDEKKKAISRYTGGLNVDVNYYLNGKTRELGVARKEIEQISKENIPILDSALAEFKRDDNIIVYRTTKISDIFENGFDYNNINKYKNIVKSHDGYMSTSILKEGTKNIKGDTFIVFKVPKEIEGAYLGKHSLIPEEYEFLIGRGVEYKIDDIYLKNNNIYINATMIKQKRSKV